MFRHRIPLEPVPASRPRVTRNGVVYYPKRYARFRRDAMALLPAYIYYECKHKSPFLGHIEITVGFYVRRPKTTKLDYPKPDYDNYLKALDVMNGIVWGDDCQIIVAHCRKAWAEPGLAGYIDLSVKELVCHKEQES